MKDFAALTRSLLDRLPAPRSDLGEESRESIPFFFIVTFVLLALYGSVLFSTPALRTPAKLIPFTVLMAAHIGLYWMVGFVPLELRWQVGYLIAQGVLALALVLLTQTLVIILGLFAALIGIAVGILRDRRLMAIAILAYFSLGAFSTVFLSGWSALNQWLWVGIPVTVFVVVYVELYTRQGEARARSQALLDELEAAHLQLAEYAARVEDLTLSAERQRMARELHDTLAQGLAGLILQLEAGSTHLEEGRNERAQEIVQQALGRARETLADARRAIGDLRAAAEGPEDFAEAVQGEVERFTTATGIPCELEFDLPDAVPEALTEHVSRIVAEALANVARHARAGRASVRVVSDAKRLVLTVSDDGQGFEPGVQRQAGHYGLVGMRERARLAGGTMTLDTAPGRGTTLSFVLPLKASE